MIHMNNGSTFISYTLAALAGICFVTGLSLLSDEGSDKEYGPREENHINA